MVSWPFHPPKMNMEFWYTTAECPNRFRGWMPSL
jgi:hypothetical protein